MSEFRELGLSSYEEDVYRSLLATGPATAAEISDISNVPRGRIYDVLNGLSARNVIQIRSNNPKQYAPVEPEAVIGILLTDRFQELKQEWNRLLGVADDLRTGFIHQSPQEGSFWFGSLGSENMTRVLQDHLKTVNDRLCMVVGPPYENAEVSKYRSELETFSRSIETNIDVDLVCSLDMLDSVSEILPELVSERASNVEIRGRTHVPLSFDIIDQSRTTIEILHPQSDQERFGFLGTTDADLVTQLYDHFEHLWETSEPTLRT